MKKLLEQAFENLTLKFHRTLTRTHTREDAGEHRLEEDPARGKHESLYISDSVF